MRMSSLEWILSTLIVIGFFAFSFWIRRRIQIKAAETIGTEKFERNKARIAVIFSPIVGVVIIGIVLFNWTSLPPGNEIIAVVFIVFGTCLILNGLYNWYRLRE